MKLLRVYPAAWRKRYGEELANLIEQLDGGTGISWRVRLDILRAGLRERLREFGPRGLAPRERAREGSLRVLYAWMLFVLAGFGFEKASEHWQAVTPAATQPVPAGAFDVLLVAAGVGSALVVLGVALLLPQLAALIRGGAGWAGIRQPILRGLMLSACAVAATICLARWAHSLTAAQRNGHDALYGAVFVVWILLLASCLFAWAAAAAATARRLAIPTGILRVEAWLGVGVSVAMLVMTGATVVWWGAIGSAATTWNVALPCALMVGATLLGLQGATRALSTRAG